MHDPLLAIVSPLSPLFISGISPTSSLLPRSQLRRALWFSRRTQTGVTQYSTAQPGPLWLPGEEDPPKEVVVGQLVAPIEDDSGTAVAEQEWQLLRQVAAEGRAGRPTDLVGAAIPADNIGGCIAAVTGNVRELRSCRRGWVLSSSAGLVDCTS